MHVYPQFGAAEGFCPRRYIRPSYCCQIGFGGVPSRDVSLIPMSAE